MANNENYQKLIASPKSSRLDEYTMVNLSRANTAGVEVDTFFSTMLIELTREDADIEFPDGIKLHSQIGRTIALSATPGQLLALIDNPNIIRFEASR